MTDPDDVGRDEGEQAQHDQFVAAQRAEFDSDEKLTEPEPNIPAVPDIMRGEPVIDFEDPLLPAFSFQFDMRERFMQTLREVLTVLREITTIDATDPEQIGWVTERIELARSLIDKTLDPADVERWNIEGRPLPSIPDVIARRGAAIDSYVGAIYASVGLDRFNIWAYDPRNDAWSMVDGPLNPEEAREALRERFMTAPVDIEYEMVAVEDDPNFLHQI